MRKMYAWIGYGFVLLELLGLTSLLLGEGLHPVALAQERYQINYMM